MADFTVPVAPDVDARLNNREAAAYLKVSTATINAWRSYRRGPKYLKVGRLVFYRKGDLDAWLTANTFDPEGE